MTTLSDDPGTVHDIAEEKIELVDGRDPYQRVMAPPDQAEIYRRKVTSQGERIFFTVEEYEHITGVSIESDNLPPIFKPYEQGTEAVQRPRLENGFQQEDLPELPPRRPIPMGGQHSIRNRNHNSDRYYADPTAQPPPPPLASQVELQIGMLEQQVAMMQQTIANLRASINQ